MKLKSKKRQGITLIEVTLATVVLVVGLMGISSFFSTIWSQLSPQDGDGGLRRYLLAEEMAKSNAEALRGTRYIWEQPTGEATRSEFVEPPPNSDYDMVVEQAAVASNATEQYVIFDIDVNHNADEVAGLSMSTLRNYAGGADVRIGL